LGYQEVCIMQTSDVNSSEFCRWLLSMFAQFLTMLLLQCGSDVNDATRYKAKASGFKAKATKIGLKAKAVAKPMAKV